MYLCGHGEPQHGVVALGAGCVLSLDGESHVASRRRAGRHSQGHGAVGNAAALHGDGCGGRRVVATVIGGSHCEAARSGGVNRTVGGDGDGEGDRDDGVGFHARGVALSLKQEVVVRPRGVWGLGSEASEVSAFR